MNREDLHEWIDELYDEYHLGEKDDPDSDYILYTVEDLLQQDERKTAILSIIISLKEILDNDFNQTDYLSPHSFIMNLEEEVESKRRLFKYERYVVEGKLEYTQEALDAGIEIL